MNFTDLSKENQDFFKKMYKLDELAAKAGGYVIECYDVPSVDIRAVDKEQRKLGRPLNEKELEKYLIKTDK